MKTKCRKCNGSGGAYRRNKWGDYFQPCRECLGKGSWWTSNKPKKKAKEQA